MNREAQGSLRSSFNFVLAEDYRVPDELRHRLEQAGFEVGIHGLEHDGRLYSSKRDFAAKARRIREYVHRWNVAGFRSPFMQHRLSWLHELGVEYDASTFDTDPFEPEPDGVGTIFPFWVSGPNGTGYVELPSTLPPDFTLFCVLRQSSIDIWKRKLDWIAERGGMALLNTHPDYMSFDGDPTRDEFPASLYDDFLSYVQTKYDGQFWSALPRDVARFYCDRLSVAARNTRRKVCMVVRNHYEMDNRVRRYAEALASRGDHVDVIGLGGDAAPTGTEVINGVSVDHIGCRLRDERSKWVHAWRLVRFLVSSSVVLTRRHHQNRYDVVHIHNMPDFLVFAAWYPKWTGAKVILDIHDVMPELFASKFATTATNLYVQLLKRIERLSAAFADHVIVSNHLWHEKLVARSVPRDKCSVFVNHVDSGIFYPRPRTRIDEKFIIVFPGTFHWHQGLDIAIQAFALLKDKVPNAELHFYGSGPTQSDLVRLARELGLDGRVRFRGIVPFDDVPDMIANADLGVVPKRADSFGDEAYSTKIMEFMSQGVPVVASRTKIDTFYFDDTVVRFFPAGNAEAMADAMLQVMTDRPARDALIENGRKYVARHSWDSKRPDYFRLVDWLSTEHFTDHPSGARDYGLQAGSTR